MRDIATTYGLVARGFSERVDAIGADQWSDPTPHADWSVRQLVAHVISTQQRVLAVLGGPRPGPVDENGDLPELWREVSERMSATLEDEAQSTKPIRGLLGEQPFEMLVGQLICGDSLVHTWELSRTIGVDSSLDPAAMAACMAILEPIDDEVRRPGGFADKVPSPADADAQTLFLNFLGEKVPVSDAVHGQHT